MVHFCTEINTHRLRNMLYAVLFTSLGLQKLLKVNDVLKAHKYAQMAYQPRENTQEIEFFITEESVLQVNHHLLGWQRWLKGEVRIHRFNTTHIDLVKLPIAENVAKTLQACINKAIAT